MTSFIFSIINLIQFENKITKIDLFIEFLFFYIVFFI